MYLPYVCPHHKRTPFTPMLNAIYPKFLKNQSQLSQVSISYIFVFGKSEKL